MPAAGTLSNLVVTLGNNVGLGVQYVFTAYHNGVADAALQCTVTGTGSNVCTDSTGSVSYAAGDTISIESVPIGPPAAASMGWWARHQLQ